MSVSTTVFPAVNFKLISANLVEVPVEEQAGFKDVLDKSTSTVNLLRKTALSKTGLPDLIVAVTSLVNAVAAIVVPAGAGNPLGVPRKTVKLFLQVPFAGNKLILLLN